MAPTTPSKGSEPMPGSLSTSSTFPRQQTPETNKPRPRLQRASTVENGAAPRVAVIQETPPGKQREVKIDTFESETTDDVFEAPRASVDMDEIPIELVSKTDKLSYNGLRYYLNLSTTNTFIFSASSTRFLPRSIRHRRISIILLDYFRISIM